MKRGSIKPVLKDPKDIHFKFQRLCGALFEFDYEFDADAGLTNPNQNLDNRPSACTSYTIADIGTDEDKVLYSHDYQYMKTLEVMNVPPDSEGADAKTAFKIACSFGLLPKDKEPLEMHLNQQSYAADQKNWPLALDAEARKNVKTAYLPIGNTPDYFDGIRSALVLGRSENRTVGMATQWSPDFSQRILPDNPKNLYWGHMYKVRGWKIINKQEYLWLETWEGTDRFMSRALCNKLLGTWGAYAATLKDLPASTIDDAKAQKNTILEVILALLQNAVIRLKQLTA